MREAAVECAHAMLPPRHQGPDGGRSQERVTRLLLRGDTRSFND